MKNPNFEPKYVAICALKFYQKTLSFDHGFLKFLRPYGYCKYRPTCSQYAIDSIMAAGLLKGGALALWRVLRCNPFSKGGNDPVNRS